MHVLFLIDQLMRAGGTELHLLDLASGLTSNAIKVSVVCFDDDLFSQKFIDHPTINYHCLNSPCLYRWKGVKALSWIHKYIRDEKVDIIQSFHTASDMVAPILGLLMLGKVTVISSRRDLGYTKEKKHVIIQKFLNKFVTLILANSKQVKQAVLGTEGVSSEKVRVIYNGINADKVTVVHGFSREKYRLNCGIPRDCMLVGALGNSRPVKGFSDFIQAARMLSKVHPDMYFSLAGESDDLRDLVDESGLSNRFFLLGPVDDVASYLSAIDIYVQPSHSEGFSNAVLEAMLAQLPVVVSDVGGNVEIVNHGKDGLLFEAKHVNDLISKINIIVGNPDLGKKMAFIAHRKVKNNFLIDKMLVEYSNLYFKICD